MSTHVSGSIESPLPISVPLTPTGIDPLVAGQRQGESSPLIYELSISSLISLDSRWEIIWKEFLLSCTVPSHPLPDHNHQEYYRNKTTPPRRFLDNMMELFLKLRRRHRLNTLQEEDNSNNDGWIASDGKYSRQFGQNHHITNAVNKLSQVLNEPLLTHRGNFYYPPYGYREWHTNKYDIHGWRMYLVHTNPSGCASFRYHEPHTHHQMIRTCPDYDGMIRLFYIRGGRETLWHCIVSEGHRWSLGVRMNQESANKMIEMYYKGGRWRPGDMMDYRVGRSGNVGENDCQENDFHEEENY